MDMKMDKKGNHGFETRSHPAVARRYPHDFTFYLGNPFPRLKLARIPTRSIAAATLTFYLAAPATRFTDNTDGREI